MPNEIILKIANEIWPIIKKGNCVAWVGSGLSRIVGYPGWVETINKLCTECKIQQLNDNEKESTDMLIDKAEECKKNDIISYQKTLADLFGKPIIQTRRAFHLLAKLPFKGFITTNFDPLLSDAASTIGQTNLSIYPALNLPLLEKVDCPIFYIHGLARQDNEPNGENLIFARSEFNEAYENNGYVSSFIVQLLINYDILFISCSLREPAMKDIFQRVHNIHEQIRRKNPNLTKRIALLASHQDNGNKYDFIGNVYKNDKDYDESIRLKVMDIEIVKYNPIDDQHGEIEEILEYLCNLEKIRISPSIPTSLSEVISS